MEENSRRQAWYLARHLRSLSGNLARWGYSEAALLVGAAAISVGESAVQTGDFSDSAPQDLINPSWPKDDARHA